MYLGIDVGGTFTDAVVIARGEIVAQAKVPTTNNDLISGLLSALDNVLRFVDAQELQRVVLSTTIVTNALVQKDIDEVGLFIIPGPGMNIINMLPGPPVVLAGYVDHRGRLVRDVDVAQLDDICRQMKDYGAYAVSGKFSIRNPQLEQKVTGALRDRLKDVHISVGSQVSGKLNFLRRTNSAYFNAAVWQMFNNFATAIEQAIAQRNILAPLYILKADGGTIPLEAARNQPIETIFTGPAASVLGIMALYQAKGEAVSIDIGGTTTDIALWRDGIPLFAERGAKIYAYPTSVRAFWLESMGIGGDSYIRRDKDELLIGPMRKGPAMALGGKYPTVADAMIVAGYADFGDRQLAEKAMDSLATGKLSAKLIAEQVLSQTAEFIASGIRKMLEQQAAEPVYRVKDIVNAAVFSPRTIIGVGGAAKGLTPLVAEKLQAISVVPRGSMMANAVGAALARPTIDITLRADTQQGYYTVPELGLRQSISRSFNLAEARQVAFKHLSMKAQEMNIPVTDMEVMYEEEFNVVRDYATSGKIILCRVQLKAGVIIIVTGKEVW